jgi:hypothetical protein
VIHWDWVWTVSLGYFILSFITGAASEIFSHTRIAMIREQVILENAKEARIRAERML